MARLTGSLTTIMLALCLMIITSCGEDDDVDDDTSPDSSTVDDAIFDSIVQEYSAASCSAWQAMTQEQRNYQLILEGLYSVDRDIWGQNSRIPCAWSSYLVGGCALIGNWDYSDRYSCNGCGGQCKEFIKELVRRASGDASHLPSGYDFRAYFLYREGDDVRKYAKPGEVVQWYGRNARGQWVQHTAIIISNLGDGRLEVVHSNWDVSNKISKRIIDLRSSFLKGAPVRSYLIGSKGCN